MAVAVLLEELVLLAVAVLLEETVPLTVAVLQEAAVVQKRDWVSWQQQSVLIWKQPGFWQ